MLESEEKSRRIAGDWAGGSSISPSSTVGDAGVYGPAVECNGMSQFYSNYDLKKEIETV